MEYMGCAYVYVALTKRLEANTLGVFVSRIDAWGRLLSERAQNAERGGKFVTPTKYIIQTWEGYSGTLVHEHVVAEDVWEELSDV